MTIIIHGAFHYKHADTWITIDFADQIKTEFTKGSCKTFAEFILQ